MDNVYIKLFFVFAVLAAARLLLLLRRVPASVRATVAEYTDSGIIASVVAIFVVTFLLQISRVEGISMQPTLDSGEYTLVDKLTYKWRMPRRGDVIVFRAPDNPEADYIKRVIALPGEQVEVHNGEVRVNNTPLQEPYEYDAPLYDFGPQRVPDGHLFVLGDNRNRSYDSHLWENPFLPMHLIHGRARIILWPPSRLGGFQTVEGRPAPEAP